MLPPHAPRWACAESGSESGSVPQGQDDGDVYEGEFVHGLRHGTGVYTTAKDGHSFEGVYEKGELVKKGDVLEAKAAALAIATGK